jgi:hypothetical protein
MQGDPKKQGAVFAAPFMLLMFNPALDLLEQEGGVVAAKSK